MGYVIICGFIGYIVFLIVMLIRKAIKGGNIWSDSRSRPAQKTADQTKAAKYIGAGMIEIPDSSATPHETYSVSLLNLTSL